MKYHRIPKDQKITINESTLIEGDILNVIKRMPDNFFQTVVTSPPYWGLRDYGVDGQIGLEKTLDEYINSLVFVFRQVRRVLKSDGVFWLNIGDGYTSGGRKWRAPDKKNPARAMDVRPDTPEGLKPKDLIGIPWRLAFALQSDGWYLRSDIIWNKPNAMPESVKDRPTRSHEYVFMFTKSEKYFYSSDRAMELSATGFRHRRTVWNINTKPFSGAHFATFPQELIEPCILSTSNEGDFVLDPFFGSGTVGVVSQLNSRKFVGVELNNDYIKMALKRIQEYAPYYLRIA